MSWNLVVITGGSGVGKSTLAQALQDELLPDQWLHLSPDLLFYCLPRSIVARVDQQNDRSQIDSKAIVSGAYACTTTLLDLGHRVIFDAVIVNEKGAENLLQAFHRFSPLLVQLVCEWPQLHSRTLARGDRTLAEAEHGYLNRGPHFVAHLTFDTTELTAEEIARQVASHMRNGTNVA